MNNIGNLFKISKGKKGQESSINTNLRYIQIEDLRGDSNIKFAHEDKGNIICQTKDILIAWDGANAGTVGYGLKGVIGSTIAKLTPKQTNISTEYCGRFLQSKFKFLRGNCTGATIPHISRSSLESLKIPLPALPIQQKIASILDAADELRQKDKALIAKYNELTQSLFLDMFGNPVSNPKGWKETTLNQLGQLKSGGTPSRAKPEYFDGNIPWITTTALGKKLINKNDANEFITETAINESSTKLIPKGSIMIGTRVGVGKASILGCDMCSNQDILSIVNLNELDINKSFLLDILSYYENYFNSQKRGATIQGITSETVKKLKIIIPPIELQNKFAERIELIEKQKQLAEESLKKSEELFNSLLDGAFKETHPNPSQEGLLVGT